jgi:hypothetical protein
MELIVGILILFFILYMFNNEQSTKGKTKKYIEKEGSIKKTIIKPDGKIINIEIPVEIPEGTKPGDNVIPLIPEILIEPSGKIELSRVGMWAEKDQYGYLFYPEEHDVPGGKKILYKMRSSYCNINKDNAECQEYKNLYCKNSFNNTNMGLCLNGNYMEAYV